MIYREHVLIYSCRVGVLSEFKAERCGELSWEERDNDDIVRNIIDGLLPPL